MIGKWRGLGAEVNFSGRKFLGRTYLSGGASAVS